MKKWIIVALIAIVGLITVVAVWTGGEEESAGETEQVNEPAEEEEEINEPEEEPEEEAEPEYANTFPLTGIATDDDVDHRAFGVMIENSAAARPQSGLYEADVVYEVLSEGRITRQLAFYHSRQPERIGPVRSARDYYIHLNNGYDAVYVSAGGSPAAFAMFERGEADYISGLTYDGRFFSRWSGRRAPHNMYTTYEDLVAASEHIGHDTEGREPPALPFSETDDEAPGTDALTVNVSYGSSVNNVMFEFDEAEGGYIRSVGGERVDDMETGEHVAPRNILAVEASHRVIDDAGRRDINIESGGPAMLFQDGRAIEAQWENRDGVILPVDEDGEMIDFLPGSTWINFVENINDVSYSGASD